MDDLGSIENSANVIRMLGGGNPASISAMERLFQGEMQRLLDDSMAFNTMIGQYGSPQGSRAFIDGLCSLLNEQLKMPPGVTITEENIAVTNGSQGSFALLFNLFSGFFQSDQITKQILLPMAPEYIGYSDVGLSDTPLFRANKPLIKLHKDHQFKYQLDFDELKLDNAIGAICVSRPTNPTGNLISDEELNQLDSLSKRAGIPLIIDGAYGLPFPNIIFDHATPIWDENIILCLSLSKLGLPGTRTGLVVGDTEVIQKITRANAIFNLAPGRFGPDLVAHTIKNGELLEMCNSVIKPYYREKSANAIAYIREVMHDLPVRIHVSQGAIFLWLWFEDLPISSDLLYQRLKAKGVFIISGHHFFPGIDDPMWKHQHECIRVSYACDDSDLTEGIAVIAQLVREAYESR